MGGEVWADWFTEADKQGNYVWLIAGEEVINAATLVAEILEPEWID